MVVIDVVSPQQDHKLAINYMTHPIHSAGAVCSIVAGLGVNVPRMMALPPPSVRLARDRAPSERAMPCRNGGGFIVILHCLGRFVALKPRRPARRSVASPFAAMR
jgi:hypothetical protein